MLLGFALAAQIMLAQDYGSGAPVLWQNSTTVAACDNGVPTVYNVGSPASGTATPTPGVPTGTATGDLLIMACETESGETCSDQAANWTTLGYSEGTGTNDSRLTILYKLAESSTPSTQLNDAGDHAYGQILGIDGETVSATTIHASTTDDRTSASASISIAGPTSTVNGCLVIAVSSDGLDGANAGDQCTDPTNASLTSLTTQWENRRGNGDGGTVCLMTGSQAAAGATGTWTYDHTASTPGGEMVVVVCGCP